MHEWLKMIKDIVLNKSKPQQCWVTVFETLQTSSRWVLSSAAFCQSSASTWSCKAHLKAGSGVNNWGSTNKNCGGVILVTIY